MTSKRNRKLSFSTWMAVIFTAVLVMCFVTLPACGEDKKVYQAGTVVGVKPHQAETAGRDNAKATNVEPQQYDLSFKVGNKIYVVLYTPPPGQNYPELGLGMDRTVFVDGDTLKVNDLLGRTRSMPILSTKDAPPKTTN